MLFKSHTQAIWFMEIWILFTLSRLLTCWRWRGSGPSTRREATPCWLGGPSSKWRKYISRMSWMIRRWHHWLLLRWWRLKLNDYQINGKYVCSILATCTGWATPWVTTPTRRVRQSRKIKPLQFARVQRRTVINPNISDGDFVIIIIFSPVALAELFTVVLS